MFTGIIQEMGTLLHIEAKDGLRAFTFSSPQLCSRLQIGSSISVDGTCLTVVSLEGESFTVEAIPETIQRTIAEFYKLNNAVNLELPLKFSDGLDGHLVTGHVDYRARIVEKQVEKDTVVFQIELPSRMAKYVAMKGSITLNGVSLTVSKLGEDYFEVSLIPHTLEVTNLGQLTQGGFVNVEVDLIARYLENLLKAKDQQITRSFLRDRGFI